MNIARSMAVCLIAVQLLAGTVYAAEMSGQERAEAAGRSLVGKRAPALNVKTIDGNNIDLGALYGKKAVYLKFWATWCVPCRAQMPHFEHAYQTQGSDLEVIAINVGFNDSVEEVQKYRRLVGITMPIVFDDGRLGSAFNLRVTPTHVVIGRDGRIQYVGHLADAKLDAALAAARRSNPAGTQMRRAPVVTAPMAHHDDTLPEESVKTVDGEMFAWRSPAAAQPTVLVFLSPWCESYLATSRPEMSANCRQARETVEALAKEKQARWIGIGSGLWANAEDLQKYRTDYQVHVPLMLDGSGTLFRRFGVVDVPTVLIADSQGKIVKRLVGKETSGLQEALAAR